MRAHAYSECTVTLTSASPATGDGTHLLCVRNRAQSNPIDKAHVSSVLKRAGVYND